jgi:hypothetical protein
MKVDVPPLVIVKPISSYEMENIHWLWPYWLGRGKLQLLAGPPGVGKTTLALKTVATVSIGGEWPDGTRAPAGDVLVWTGEDGIADTIKPRLVAMGADTTKIHVLSEVTDGNSKRPFDPSTDIIRLGSALDRIKPAMLMLDPVSSAIIGDSHKAAEVRRGLQPVVDLLVKHNIAGLGITHFRKGSKGDDPLDRVIASVGFTAGPRLIMVAIKAANGGGNRIARAKSNIGPDGDGFEYQLVQTHVSEESKEVDVAAQYIEWGAPLVGNARDLLAVEEPEKDASALDEATHFLEQQLASRAPVAVKDIKEAAQAYGVAWRTIERAKKQLDKPAGRILVHKGGLTQGWSWQLTR